MATIGIKHILAGAGLIASLLGATPAQADWRYGWHGRWHGYTYGPPPRVYHYHRHHHSRRSDGDAVLGTILGLGTGVVIGTMIAPRPPVVVQQVPGVIYAPPPVIYHHYNEWAPPKPGFGYWR